MVTKKLILKEGCEPPPSDNIIHDDDIHRLAGWLHTRYSGDKRKYALLNSIERKEWRDDAKVVLNVYMPNRVT